MQNKKADRRIINGPNMYGIVDTTRASLESSGAKPDLAHLMHAPYDSLVHSSFMIHCFPTPFVRWSSAPFCCGSPLFSAFAPASVVTVVHHFQQPAGTLVSSASSILLRSYRHYHMPKDTIRGPSNACYCPYYSRLTNGQLFWKVYVIFFSAFISNGLHRPYPCYAVAIQLQCFECRQGERLPNIWSRACHFLSYVAPIKAFR